MSRLAVRRAADLVVNRLDLVPPVDVWELLRARVDRLERVDWPQEDVDAIFTGLGSDGTEIAVFVRESDNAERERFTVAHELGHLLLPWHLPSSACSVLELDSDVEGGEREADLFASCLLVPDRWLSELMGAQEVAMAGVLEALSAARISTAAALQALRRYLLPGWVFVAYGGNSVVASRGTVYTRLPQNGGWGGGAAAATEQMELLRSESTDHGSAILNGHTVHWFQLTRSAALPSKAFDDGRSMHQMLMDAIEAVGYAKNAAVKVSQSANGKVGGTLNEASGRPASEIYQAMEHKLADWEHASLLAEPDFRIWLAEKARMIEAKGAGV